jgi:MFS family permease
MMSYPTEATKGRYIGYFWAIFNLGAVIGAAIPIGQNWNSTENSVNDGTYIAFFVLMVAGFVLAFFLAPPHKIIRDDLTMVEHIRHPSAWYFYFTSFLILQVRVQRPIPDSTLRLLHCRSLSNVLGVELVLHLPIQ